MVLVAGVATVVGGGAAAARADQAAPAPVADAGGATEVARRSGQPVEVLSQRSEVSRTLANADGTFTSEVYARPQWARRGGGWVPVDTTLRVNADGSVSPVAAVVDLRLSGGGTGPLVTMASRGRRIGLVWPHALPVPSLSGDTATYAEVLPGVDLRVSAEVDGYREVLVVKDRAAAAHPGLRQVRFGLLSDGVAVGVRADGGLAARDAAGAVVFAGDAPMMWDSPRMPARVSAAEPAEERPGPARRAQMPLAVAGGQVTLVPDRAVLDDPATSYPVMIDPASSTVTEYNWTHINKTYPNQSYWSYDRADGAKVGYSNWSSPIVTYRSFFLFSFSGWQGRTVTSATFQITVDHTASCGDTPADLWRTRNISPSTAVTWNNASDTSATGTWQAKLATDSASANESSCPVPDELMEFGNVQSSVQTAVNGGAQLTLGLRAPNEADPYQWKKFLPTTAKLVVGWNVAANTPGSLSTVPPTPCGTASNPTPLNTATPQFTARLSDPYDDNVFGTLTIRNNAGTAIHSVNTPTVVSDTVVAWPAIPAGVLPTNQPTTVFSYEAAASDASMASAPTGRCYFTVDQQIPGTPVVASTDFPNGEPMLPVGQVGTLTLSPGYGPLGLPDTDVSGYRYGFQQDRLTGWAGADASGNATIPMVLWSSLGRTLYVQAVDRAGNPSISEEPCICTSWDLRATASAATPAREPGDVNGDGLADVSTLFDLGNGRTTAWTLVRTTSGGFYQPYLGWDTGINGGFDGYRVKHLTGDFTGDGLADMVVFREDPDQRLRLFLLRSDSHRYDADSAPLWEGPAASTWTLNRIQPVVVDADGDGKLDIATMNAVTTTTYNYNVFRNTTSGTTVSFAAPTSWWPTPTNSGEASRMKVVGGDFNGDGKGDVGHYYNYDNNQTKLWVHYSTGTGFDTGHLMWDSGVGGWDWNRGTFTTGDFTGDGKTDVIGVYDYGTYTRMWLWQGSTSTFPTPNIWWDGNPAGSTFLAPRARLVPGDLNNDGRTDITAVYDPTAATAKAHTFLSNGTTATAPNLAAPAWSGNIGAVPANITPEPGRKYRLVASHSNKCVQAHGGSLDNSTPVTQWGCVNMGHHQFTFEPIGNGPYYRVKFVHSGKCLNVSGARRDNNAPIIQWPCVDNGNDIFRLEYIEGFGQDVKARLRVAHTEMCLNISGASTADGGAAIQYQCVGGGAGNELFYVRLLP